MNLDYFDFVQLWLGRPKAMPLSIHICPVYVFSITGPCYNFVRKDNSRYVPKDWRGML